MLAAPRDEGYASYQVVLSVCPECDSGRQQAAGGLVPVDPGVIRMAHCDAQHIGSLPGPSAMPDASSAPANDLEPDESRGDDPETSDPANAAPDAPVGASTRGSSCSLDHQNAQDGMSRQAELPTYFQPAKEPKAASVQRLLRRKKQTQSNPPRRRSQ